jgi:hypothetical protein
VDRQLARRRLGAGFTTGAIAAAVFALAFVFAILYIAH